VTRASARVEKVKPSATLAISGRAAQLKRAGRDIATLSVGEPDFPLFPNVEEAIHEALRRGHTKYTASPGLAELREAIADWTFEELGIRYPISQILGTAGAKQALYNACQATLDEGDEAVIPNPYWVSYPEMVRLAGGTVRELECRPEDGWAPRPEALEKVLNERTRVFMMGSPANPTGAVWSAEVLRGLAGVLQKFPRVVILSDDIYDKLSYLPGRAPNFLAVAPELKDRTVLVNGCSKSYAMTGLRLGWACGPADLIAGMNKVQDASTSNPSSLAQHGAIAALRGPQQPLAEMKAAFMRRRDLIIELLSKVPGVSCHKPDGAYYVFADVRAVLGKKFRGQVIATSLQLAELLLEEFSVAVVQGSAFGREGYLRLSFATSDAEIRKAVDRVAQGLAALE